MDYQVPQVEEIFFNYEEKLEKSFEYMRGEYALLKVGRANPKLLDKIIHKKAWVKISNKYNIDYNKYHYKTYSYDDIFLMCKYLFTDKMKNKDIVKLFPEYDSKKLSIMIKSLKAKRIYKKVIYDYERSTTIENKK